MIRLLVLGSLLAAGPASAGLPEFSTAVEGLDFAAARAIPQGPPAAAAAAAVAASCDGASCAIQLAPLLDGVRATKATFRAGNVVVHVFGGKSQNKKSWFVGFMPEGGEAQFRNGHKMIHWMMLNRTVHFEVAGRRFSAWIEGKVTDKMNSRLVVAAESGERSSWTVQQLSDYAFDAGERVVLAGKEYRLMYTRDFNEDDNGEFAGYTGDRSLSLLTRQDGKLIGYHWFERDIPIDRILVSRPKAVGADSASAGTLAFGLRLSGGVLDLSVAASDIAGR
jgi:predicted lactoylglutathione lyase